MFGQSIQLCPALLQGSDRIRCRVNVVSRFALVRLVEFARIFGDAGVELLSFLCDPLLVHHAKRTRCRSKLGAVNGNETRSEQSLIAAEEYEGTAGADNRATVVPSEVGDGLVVWRKAPCRPERFEIASALAFEPP